MRSEEFYDVVTHERLEQLRREAEIDRLVKQRQSALMTARRAAERRLRNPRLIPWSALSWLWAIMFIGRKGR